MLIVLEGCDGTGKSSIAKLLKAIMSNSQIVHCTADTPNDFKFFSNLIEIGGYKNLILDRGMYGQFVYQEPKDRHLSTKDLRRLEIEMLKTGAKVVHVTASEEVVIGRLRVRYETPMHPVHTLLDGFDRVFEESILPVVTIDTSNGIEIGGKI